MTLIQLFSDPPRNYALIPFWFLNDDLDEDELRRQMDDFVAHGVYGVVPHARIGLPEEIAFMSDRYLHFLKVITEHAAERDMQVILYDEGMYPSGSAAGQVVAANPIHASRALERSSPRKLADGEVLVTEIGDWWYINTRSGGTIRGVHFGTDDGEPGAPPSGDILNPEAVASFLHLVHDRHYEVLGEYFGNTISAIFTDEPHMLGRGHKRGVQPWTWEFPEFFNRLKGYDIVAHLPALWDDTYPDAARYREDFREATQERLRSAFYQPYYDWCEAHHVALTGHPAGSMDLGHLRYFHFPGQDVVWRYVEPFKDSALVGEHSTMAKCSLSAQQHFNRTRNLNECFGAFGWEFTYEEMRWLTNWLLVRGVNMISPHAFYYSIRGPRRDERPPDVGPNNVWWDRYKPYADYCRRVSWLLATGHQVCDIAILSTPYFLPWTAAGVLFEHQWDFNYLDNETLCRDARVDEAGIHIGKMHYKVLIVDHPQALSAEAQQKLQPFIDAGRVFAYGQPASPLAEVAGTPEQLEDRLNALLRKDVRLSVLPQAATARMRDIRYHHVALSDTVSAYFFTNEGSEPVHCQVGVRAGGNAVWLDPETGQQLDSESGEELDLLPYTGKVLWVTG